MKTITKHYIDGAFVESHGRENTTHSSTLVAEVQGYAELQREVHDALRAQHPEWIEADGKSPTCDSYELRLAELLVSHRNEEVPSKRVPRLFPRARACEETKLDAANLTSC